MEPLKERYEQVQTVSFGNHLYILIEIRLIPQLAVRLMNLERNYSCYCYYFIMYLLFHLSRLYGYGGTTSLSLTSSAKTS